MVLYLVRTVKRKKILIQYLQSKLLFEKKNKKSGILICSVFRMTSGLRKVPTAKTDNIQKTILGG